MNMRQVLIVETSPRKESFSRKLARKVEARIKSKYPKAQIVYRDLAKEPLPHLGELAVDALLTRGELTDPALKQALNLSDKLIDELLASDLIVVASPMWNFGIPSGLKAWIDHVVRAGRTFNYTANGPVGHAAGTKAILVTSSAGTYTAGPLQSWNFAEPYLKQMLNFIGITDLGVVRFEGQFDFQGQFNADAFASADKSVDEISI
jgi:FMN-dependent NADH-azoreductase